MIRTIISFASVIILSTSFSALAKTKVTWSMESNADRDPIMIEKLQRILLILELTMTMMMMKKMTKKPVNYSKKD